MFRKVLLAGAKSRAVYNYGSQPDDDDLIRFHQNATQA